MHATKSLVMIVKRETLEIPMVKAEAGRTQSIHCINANMKHTLNNCLNASPLTQNSSQSVFVKAETGCGMFHSTATAARDNTR